MMTVRSHSDGEEDSRLETQTQTWGSHLGEACCAQRFPRFGLTVSTGILRSADHDAEERVGDGEMRERLLKGVRATMLLDGGEKEARMEEERIICGRGRDWRIHPKPKPKSIVHRI